MIGNDPAGKKHVENFIQDQTTRTVSLFMHEHIGGPITLTADVNLDDVVLPVLAGHGAVDGNLICLKEGIRFYQGEVLDTTATTITVDSPLDFAFSTGANCTATSHHMNVDGSSATRTFHVRPNEGVDWDIKEITFFIEGTAEMSSDLFGDIAAIANGIVVRKKDGEYVNIFNIKSNGDFATRAFKLEYDPKAGSGKTAVRVTRQFSEQNGVVIRLHGDEFEDFQVLVRDKIDTLSRFEAVIQGHRVQD